MLQGERKPIRDEAEKELGVKTPGGWVCPNECINRYSKIWIPRSMISLQ